MASICQCVLPGTCGKCGQQLGHLNLPHNDLKMMVLHKRGLATSTAPLELFKDENYYEVPQLMTYCRQYLFR